MSGWMGLTLLLATAPAGPAAAEQVPEHARRLLDEALLAGRDLDQKGQDPSEELLARFRAAANAAPQYTAAQFDLAVALEKSGKLADAETAWRAAAAAKAGDKALRATAADRALRLALIRKDEKSAREAAELYAAVSDRFDALAVQGELELALGKADRARPLFREALMGAPKNARALSGLARASLALGEAGAAKILALRAAAEAPHDARPHLVLAEIARAANEGAEELAQARAAAAADASSIEAQMLIGKLLSARGDAAGAQAAFAKAAEIDPDQAGPHFGLGAALAEQGKTAAAVDELYQAAELSPGSPAPHLLLAHLKLDREHDPAAALAEAKLFLKLSPAVPSNHRAYLLVQRCERLLAPKVPGKPVAVVPGSEGDKP